MTLLDEHGQPTNKGLNWHRNFVKSVQSLLGLCKGLLADNVMNEQEIIFVVGENDHHYDSGRRAA